MNKQDFLKQATKEQMDLILAAKSAKELMILAKEHEVELSEFEAAEAMKNIASKATGELSDDDLDAVAGGAYKDGYLVVTVGYGCEYYSARSEALGNGTCCLCNYLEPWYDGLEVCLHPANMQK
ncbi:hypothetical protein [Eubacterium callanderi]|uniref:hypothetical protein n=1 Tax=Eubacterium callanderi TaxID=53442 RepID=UPI001C0FEB2D|nr:hypothetical protein [Eubacterium callanderi]MBU5302649.1 hypothetical protein [Eubacterium callanderi]WPK69705.1 hypothetical protein EUCA2A_38950 [Eubacterium callanderi]WPK74003.1 hypothetical protein EUCA11A_38950 [Eubacterium callanderi]